ncbi:MAG: XapX domain-containing protein [Spirochaetaceae bacterium]|jgi:XapX domain-containing protein|nr:XapX domain-containing protein [Spirochaetaceae bacterium]
MVIQLLVCFGVGILIGVIFTLLHLPVPVPHGLGGLVGLIGMFAGGVIAAKVIAIIASHSGQ